jgi:hypothetical protein
MDNIYVLKSDGFYKIGTSVDIDKRIKELQTGNPHTIECIFSRQVPEAYKVEQSLHASFEKHRIIGEWFKFNDMLLKKLKELIIFHMRVCDINLEDKEHIKNCLIFKSNQKE